MKRVLKIGAVSFLCLIVVLIGVGFLLPGAISLETRTTIDAPPERVWPFVSSTDGLAAMWKEVGMAEMQLRHAGGPTAGVGTELEFVVGESVYESWKITAAEEARRVVYEVDFRVFVVERTLTLAPLDGGTVVVWREVGEVTNPFMRYMLLLSSQEEVVANFDKALAGLKAVAEAG